MASFNERFGALDQEPSEPLSGPSFDALARQSVNWPFLTDLGRRHEPVPFVIAAPSSPPQSMPQPTSQPSQDSVPLWLQSAQQGWPYRQQPQEFAQPSVLQESLPPSAREEASMAQDARAAAAYRMSQQVRPIGGREQGPVTDFILDAMNPIPQSPLDYGLMVLGTPLKLPLKVGALALSALLESSDAEAGRRPRTPGRGAAPREPRLPMDDKRRIARATAMKFHMDMPLGHGTNAEFTEFDPSKFSSMTGARTARQGVWLEVNPQPGGIAEEFAEEAVRTRRTGSARVMPLVHRAEKPGQIRLRGNESAMEIEATLAQAWDDGFDAVMFHNYTSPGGRTGTTLVVKDPAQLRFPWAEFDPRKRNSRDLRASVDARRPALG